MWYIYFTHRNHKRQIIILVGEGREIIITGNMKLLVCLQFQAYIELPEEQEHVWMKKTIVNMKVKVIMDQTLMSRTLFSAIQRNYL